MTAHKKCSTFEIHLPVNNFTVWQFARETAEDDRIREKFAQAIVKLA